MDGPSYVPQLHPLDRVLQSSSGDLEQLGLHGIAQVPRLRRQNHIIMYPYNPLSIKETMVHHIHLVRIARDLLHSINSE